MSTFTKPLKVELIDGHFWRLIEEFEYYTTINNKMHIIRVPAGYITDFASIPRCFHSFLSYKDVFNKASVVHDYLCDTDGDYSKFSKEQVDKIYLEAQSVLGINPIKARIFYTVVTWFGTIDYYDWNQKIR